MSNGVGVILVSVQRQFNQNNLATRSNASKGRNSILYAKMLSNPSRLYFALVIRYPPFGGSVQPLFRHKVKNEKRWVKLFTLPHLTGTIRLPLCYFFGGRQFAITKTQVTNDGLPFDPRIPDRNTLQELYSSPLEPVQRFSRQFEALFPYFWAVDFKRGPQLKLTRLNN